MFKNCLLLPALFLAGLLFSAGLLAGSAYHNNGSSLHCIRGNPQDTLTLLTHTAGGKPHTSDLFGSRYFLSASTLPLQKGENYILWNLYGPDFQWGLTGNFSLGLMTSWFATPIIASARYRVDLPGEFSAGAGLLLGTGSWVIPSFGVALPYGVLSLGNQHRNLSFSMGYGGLFYKVNTRQGNPFHERRVNDARLLMSLAGMIRLNSKVSLVFDSFLIPPANSYEQIEYGSIYNPDSGMLEEYSQISMVARQSMALIIPGLRVKTSNTRAFQIGMAALYFDSHFWNTAIPVFQWHWQF